MRKLLIALALAVMAVVVVPTEASANTRTWGYVGCSNTHDAMYGYQHTVGTAGHFWPWANYHIEGGTVHKWLTNGQYFQQFEAEVQTYDGGQDPPVILIQACAQIDPTESNYWPLNQDDLTNLVADVHTRHPSSVLYVSPLQDYGPVDLCPRMGLNGIEIPTYQDWMSQLVATGAALAGPGVNGNTDLGPLAQNGTVWTDDCHPTGDPNHKAPFQGSGVQLLGQQLSVFFDHL